MKCTCRHKCHRFPRKRNIARVQVVEFFLKLGPESSKHMSVQVIHFLKPSTPLPVNSRDSLSSLKLSSNISSHNTVEKVIALDMKAVAISASTVLWQKKKASWIGKRRRCAFLTDDYTYLGRHNVSALLVLEKAQFYLSNGPIVHLTQT